MARAPGRSMWPQHLPWWLLRACDVALVIAFVSFLVVLLPHSLVGKVKFLRSWRAYILKSFKRIGHYWRKSPLYRLTVFIGRKCFVGRLSSRCRTPGAFKVSAKGCRDVIANWRPRLPSVNAFHEERYICATRLADGSEDWAERVFREDDVDVRSDGLVRAFLEKLPVQTQLQVRVCAENSWGRSPWSEVAEVETLAKPIDGGFTGPLGPAGRGLGFRRDTYTWTQKRGEVCFKVPIGADWPGRDISFKATPQRLEILHVPRLPGSKAAPTAEPPEPERILLAGHFPKRVKADEVFWDIDDVEPYGRHLDVKMTKYEAMDKWKCLLEEEGHPRIDERLVKIYTQDMDGLGKGGIDIFE